MKLCGVRKRKTKEAEPSLKPCPFCGELADASSGRFNASSWAWVECSNCEIGYRTDSENETPKALLDKCVRKWNTRIGD